MHRLNLLTVDLEQRGLYYPRLQNVEFKCPKFSVLGQTGSLTLGQKERKTANRYGGLRYCTFESSWKRNLSQQRLLLFIPRYKEACGENRKPVHPCRECSVVPRNLSTRTQHTKVSWALLGTSTWFPKHLV